MTSTALPAGFLLGIEGVLVLDGVPVPGSVEAIVRLRAMGCPFRVLSEPTSSSPNDLATRLGESGFSIDPEEILVAGAFDGDAPMATASDSARKARVLLLGEAAADLRLPKGATILVVGSDFESEIGPALDLGFSALLVRSGGAVEESRVGQDIPEAIVAQNLGAWLYRVLRLR